MKNNIVKHILSFIYVIFAILGIVLISIKYDALIRSNSITLDYANHEATTLYRSVQSFIDKLEIQNNNLGQIDMVYCGKLYYEEKEYPKLNSTDLQYQQWLNSKMPVDIGYCYVMIDKSNLVQVYWSKSKDLVLYKDYISKQISQNEISSIYIGGDMIGGYPMTVSDCKSPDSEYYNKDTPVINSIRTERNIIILCYFIGIISLRWIIIKILNKANFILKSKKQLNNE